MARRIELPLRTGSVTWKVDGKTSELEPARGLLFGLASAAILWLVIALTIWLLAQAT